MQGDMTTPRAGDEITARVPAALAITLSQVGWELREVNINLVNGRAVMRLFRADGRWLYLAASADGSGSIERWHRDQRDQRGMGGSGPLFGGIDDTFLGRTRCATAEATLLALADYVAENPAPGRAALPTATARAAFRLVMNEQEPEEHTP